MDDLELVHVSERLEQMAHVLLELLVRDVPDEIGELDGGHVGHGENDVALQAVAEEQRDDVALAVRDAKAVDLGQNAIRARCRNL